VYGRRTATFAHGRRKGFEALGTLRNHLLLGHNRSQMLDPQHRIYRLTVTYMQPRYRKAFRTAIIVAESAGFLGIGALSRMVLALPGFSNRPRQRRKK
jgi:hypothetical protein